MAKYEDKFIVINKKHLDRIPSDLRKKFMQVLEEVEKYLPHNDYVVVNKDESYFSEVMRIILKREEEKEQEWSFEDSL